MCPAAYVWLKKGNLKQSKAHKFEGILSCFKHFDDFKAY
jgi:hypothetical protein